jgi:D-glycero-D-manno-heptose 1,7-bisphosphate phosphatase
VIGPSGGRPLPAIFLDRDGTINVGAEEDSYITSPGQLRLLPGAAEAIRLFNRLALLVVVVTNQRAVARGTMTEEDLVAVTDRLDAILASHGAHIDATYACVHAEGACDCRKPAPGLILRAAREWPRIALESSVMIGDAESDVLAGKAAGVRTVRLGPSGTRTAADALCGDLHEASRLVLARLGPESGLAHEL